MIGVYFLDQNISISRYLGFSPKSKKGEPTLLVTPNQFSLGEISLKKNFSDQRYTPGRSKTLNKLRTKKTTRGDLRL